MTIVSIESRNTNVSTFLPEEKTNGKRPIAHSKKKKNLLINIKSYMAYVQGGQPGVAQGGQFRGGPAGYSGGSGSGLQQQQQPTPGSGAPSQAGGAPREYRAEWIEYINYIGHDVARRVCPEQYNFLFGGQQQQQQQQQTQPAPQAQLGADNYRGGSDNSYRGGNDNYRGGGGSGGDNYRSNNNY